MVSARHAALAIVALAMGAAACEVIAGIGNDDFTYTPPPLPLPSPSPLPEEEAAAPRDPCHHAAPPPVPEIADMGDKMQFVFAVRSISVTGRSPSGDILGFDLDGVCTCDTRPGSAHGGEPSCKLPAKAVSKCDYNEAGVDNSAVAPLDYIFGNVPGTDPAQINDGVASQIECGKRGVLILLSGYNGLANDSYVTVSMLVSFGIHDSHGDAGEVDAASCVLSSADAGPGEIPYRPKWDGTDKWSVPATDLTQSVDGYIPKVPSVRGWVSNYTLVIDRRDPSATDIVPIVLGRTVGTISTPALAARLVPIDAKGKDIALGSADAGVDWGGGSPQFRLADSVLTGRMAVDDMLKGLGTLKFNGKGSDDSTDGFLCLTPYYVAFKDLICRSPDTLLVPERDFKGDSCDAVSIVALLGASPSQLVLSANVPPPPDAGCPVDTCATTSRDGAP